MYELDVCVCVIFLELSVAVYYTIVHNDKNFCNTAGKVLLRNHST